VLRSEGFELIEKQKISRRSKKASLSK
jgi:hypothetical protein